MAFCHIIVIICKPANEVDDRAYKNYELKEKFRTWKGRSTQENASTDTGNILVDGPLNRCNSSGNNNENDTARRPAFDVNKISHVGGTMNRNNPESDTKKTWRSSCDECNPADMQRYKTNLRDRRYWHDVMYYSAVQSNTGSNFNQKGFLSNTRGIFVDFIAGIAKEYTTVLNDKIHELMSRQNSFHELTDELVEKTDRIVEDENLRLMDSMEKVFNQAANQMMNLATRAAENEHKRIESTLEADSRKRCDHIRKILDSAETQIVLLAKNYSLSNVADITKRIQQNNASTFNLISRRIFEGVLSKERTKVTGSYRQESTPHTSHKENDCKNDAAKENSNFEQDNCTKLFFFQLQIFCFQRRIKSMK